MNTFTAMIATTVITLNLATSSLVAKVDEPIPQPIVEQVEIKKEISFKEKLETADIVQRRKLLFEKISELSKKYNTNANEIYATIATCENRAIDSDLQSGMRYPRDNARWGVKAGEREKSFGLAMIHLPDHPNITYAQATDPEFALEFMAKEFSQGRKYQWTCYRNLFASK